MIIKSSFRRVRTIYLAVIELRDTKEGKPLLLERFQVYLNILDQNHDFTEVDTIQDSNLDLAAAAVHLHKLLQDYNPRLFQVFALQVCSIAHSLLQSLSWMVSEENHFGYHFEWTCLEEINN